MNILPFTFKMTHMYYNFIYQKLVLCVRIIFTSMKKQIITVLSFNYNQAKCQLNFFPTFM